MLPLKDALIPINLTTNVLTNIVIFPDSIALYSMVSVNIPSNGKLIPVLIPNAFCHVCDSNIS